MVLSIKKAHDLHLSDSEGDENRGVPYTGP